MTTTTATHIAYIDYGRIADPGVAVMPIEEDGGPGNPDLYVDDERFRADFGDYDHDGESWRDASDRWDEALEEHGWRRTDPQWTDSGDQATAHVERIQ